MSRERATLLTFVDDCGERDNETAIVCRRGQRVYRWSYARLAATAYQFSRELEERRIGKGDRVLIHGANSPEWIAAFFGCLLRGTVAVPLDKQSAPDLIGRVQTQVRAKLLLTDTEETSEFDLRPATLRLDELGDLVTHHSAAPVAAGGANPSDLIEIIFTSGTTAEPRGVCITHRNFLANLEPLERKMAEYRRWERLAHPVRFLSLLPLSHIFGQFMGIFVPQLLGGEVFFQESLKPTEIIETVHRRRVTVIVGFPRLLETLRDHVERNLAANRKLETFTSDFAAAEGRPFLRRAVMFRQIHRRFGWKFWAFVSGGATLNRETEEFWRRLGYAVVHGYGMTETASIISMPNPFHLKPGSIGKVLPGHEVKLDEQGQILIRGENVAAGYWSGEEGMTPMTGDEGWLRTGDIGEFDAQGNLFFRGREKDVIVSASGMKIHPEDLEAALDSQGEVSASCVIGIDGLQGPEAVAVLILGSEHDDPAVIVSRANDTLAPHQHMRRWVVWPEDDFPRTTTAGKVIRRLVAGAVRGTEGKASKPKATGSDVTRTLPFILQQAARISGELVSQPSATSSLSADLKLDSLGRVELLSALEERYQVELDEATFTTATTLGDIEKMIHEGAQEVLPYSYPNWPRTFPVTWIRLVVYNLVSLPITRLMCWVRVTGRDHLRGVDGPVLFVSNHVTMVDPALILSALPVRWRGRLTIAMAGEFLREWRHPPEDTPWWRRFILEIKYALVVALFNVFPLPQQSGFRRSFAFAGETVDRGDSILVFPEGQRTKHGRLNPFMSGAGLLVKTLNVPVIPVRIDGLFELAQQRRYFARPGRVVVKFGEPIKFSPAESPVQITSMLEARVNLL